MAQHTYKSLADSLRHDFKRESLNKAPENKAVSGKPNIELAGEHAKTPLSLDVQAIRDIYLVYLPTLDGPITIDNQPAFGSPIP
ncbi:hypothetical protein D6I95_15790 [Alcaligenes faecalis]|nr:hypothetical protein D6I95_15790 [Alcaligenes faecalis]